MWNPRLVGLLLAFGLLAAQPAPEAGPGPAVVAASQAPVLRPGEGFAITLGDGGVRAFGEARREAPMGSLAKLVWMRLEGSDWASRGVRYKCTGKAGSFTCWKHQPLPRNELSWNPHSSFPNQLLRSHSFDERGLAAAPGWRRHQCLFRAHILRYTDDEKLQWLASGILDLPCLVQLHRHDVAGMDG